MSLVNRVRAAEHAPRNPFRVLERRHGLAEVVERGAVVLHERPRVVPRVVHGREVLRVAAASILRTPFFLLRTSAPPPCSSALAEGSASSHSSHTRACGRGAVVDAAHAQGLRCQRSQHRTHRGALWASGAAQAAHVVRIILRFAVSYWVCAAA